jgi:platelet-activating factor acetylhydrolase
MTLASNDCQATHRKMFSLTPRPASPVGCADLLLRMADGSTVFARLYYPARPAGWLTSLLRRRHAAAPAWLPYPRSLDGFLSFVASNLDTGQRKRPQGPLLSALRRAFTVAAGAVHYLLTRLPAVWHAQPAPGAAPLPVVLFSHGLGGNRNAYSGHVLQLAQHGSLVACVEHSDGTSSLTHSHDHHGRPGAWRYYQGVGLPGER